MLTTLTAPHTISAEILSELRSRPLPEHLHNLPAPHIGLIIGDPLSRTTKHAEALQHFLTEVDKLTEAAGSFWIIGSRRTPPEVMEALKQHLKNKPHWLWQGQGQGENPYKLILARADALAVTADSHNMVGEALATGSEVIPITPLAINPKLGRFIQKLKVDGYVKSPVDITGKPQSIVSQPGQNRPPLDATKEIAAAIRLKMAEHAKAL
ncbi:MAG: hypothetical protein DHS20C08_08790 [Rhodomicrobium sp.]|nr:MAG: hypothetical protein DHS20C08_08790 [Rhodomicrobium sp.]